MEVERDALSNGGRGADIISRIVAKYVVPSKTARNLGYEEDDEFFDDEEQVERQRKGDVETAHGGFFINAGDIDTKKRKREPSPIPDESPMKRRRGNNDRDLDAIFSTKALDPAIEDAILEFSDAVKKGGYTDAKRFPKELDPFLAKVAQVASSKHPNGWISLDVCNRVAQHIPLQPSTLRARMKMFTSSSASKDVNGAPSEDDDDHNDPHQLPGFYSAGMSKIAAGGDDGNGVVNAEAAEDRLRRLEHYKRVRDDWMSQFRESVERKLSTILSLPEIAQQIQALRGQVIEGSMPPGRDRWRWAPDQKQLIVSIYEVNSKIVRLHNRVRQELIVIGRAADSNKLGPEMAERNEVSVLYKFFVNCFPPGWYSNQSFAQMVAVERKKNQELAIPPMNGSSNGIPHLHSSQPIPHQSSQFMSSQAPLSHSQDVSSSAFAAPVFQTAGADGGILIQSIGAKKQRIRPKAISSEEGGDEAASQAPEFVSQPAL